MSALNFKITATYKELTQAIAELDKFEAKIKNINSPNLDFEHLNKQMEELSKTVEKKSKLFAEMAMNNSANVEAQTVQANAMAYKDYDAALRQVIGTQSQNVARLVQEESALASVKAQITELNKQAKMRGYNTSEDIKKKQLLVSLENEHKQAISGLRQAINSEIKMNQAASGSMDEMSQALGRMRMAYRSLNESERSSTFGQNLLKQIQATDAHIKELDKTIGNHQRNVGNYEKATEGIERSIQRVSRTLPSLIHSPRQFITSLTYALPQLQRELKNARVEFDTLKASGQSATPVWKQLAKSIVSWQTLIVAAIALLVRYKDEIWEWINGTNAADKAHKKFIQSIKEGNNEYANAYKELAKLESMFQNIDGTYITAEDALRKYNETLGDTIGKETSLARAKQNVIDKKEAYLSVIIQQAKANAYLAEMTNLAAEAEAIRMNNTVTFWDKVKGSFLAAAKGEKFASVWDGSDEWTNAVLKQREDAAQKLDDKIKELQDKYFEEDAKTYNLAKQFGFDLSPEDEKKGEQSVNKLKELHQKAIDARREIAEKAKEEQLNIRQLELDLDKDSTEKKIKQIELNTDKELHALDKKYESLKKANQELAKLENEKSGKKGTPEAKLTSEQEDTYLKEMGLIFAKREKMINEANNEKLRRSQEAWSQYIKEFGTFQQKKIDIQDTYDKKILEAQTDNEKKLLEAQKKKAIDSLELENFKTSINFADIFSNIDRKSTDSIQALRDVLAEYIEQAADSLTPEQLKPLTDALLKMDDVLRDRKPMDGISVSIKGAIKAYNELKDAKKKGLSIEEVKVFEIAFKDAMTRVAEDIQNVLNYLSDFGNIGVDIISVFNEDAADTASDLLDIASGAGQAGVGVARLAGGDIIGGVKDLAKGISNVVGGIVRMNDKLKEQKIQKIQTQIDTLGKSYRGLEEAIDRSYSKDASNLIRQNNEILQQQQLLIKQQIEQEKAKKKTDEKKIKQWEETYEEINKKIEKNKERAVDAIMGEDIKAAIDRFADAYSKMWESGEDKRTSAKNLVKDMMHKMVIEALKADVAKPMEILRAKMEQFWDDDIFTEEEEEELQRMAESMFENIEKQYAFADRLFKQGEEQGAASYGAYEKITQDQAGSIDGRLTGIHMNTIDSLEQSKLHVLAINAINSKIDITNKILDEIRMHNENIQEYTERIPDKKFNDELKSVLDRIDSNTKNI